MKKRKNTKKPPFIFNMIFFFILLGFASLILEKIAPLVPFLIGIAITIIIFYFVIKSAEKKKKTMSPAIRPQPPESPGIHTEEIRRQIVAAHDSKTKYVRLSTSGDDNVCPMCAQFEGKIFPENRAPKLPLCPSCACAYLYYFNKNDLPPNAVISDMDDFVLPSEHAKMFYNTQQQACGEDDINECIRICERQIKKLSEFMQPYIAAGFPAPCELACRDLLPKLYIQLGKWEKAEKTIKACTGAGAYYPDDGSAELAYLKSYQKVAAETLSHISLKG